MNKTHSLRVLLFFCSLPALLLAPAARAASSSPGSGEIAIYTEAAGGDVIAPNGSIGADFLVHDFDTTVREDTDSFTLAGADVTLNRAGHYLAIYNARFDGTAETGSEERIEVQSHLTLAGTALPTGWSQGYIRRQNTQRAAITTGMAVFEALAGDSLQVHSFRTDTTTVGTATRTGNATGLQLVKLDDINMSYARLSLAFDQGGPTTDTTWVKVAYDTTDELDAGFSHDTAGDLVLADAGKYLVVANSYIVESNDRSALIQRLTLDGTEVAGSKTTVYIRGTSANQSCQDGAAAIGMIIDAAAGQVLNVEGILDVARPTCNYIGGRCALTVVKLPSAAAGTVATDPDYIRLRDEIDQNVNGGSDVPLLFGIQDEVDGAFSHVPDASAVTVNTDGDYLFLSAIYDDNDQVQRGYYAQGWSVNGGAKAVYGQSGQYSRSTGGADQFGNTSAFIGDGLVATDTVEMVSSALGNGGTNNVNRVSLQGVRLASLFSTEAIHEVKVIPVVIAAEEGGATATYEISLGLPPDTGSVEVTVTADADTEVSLDGATFSATVSPTFTDTTPQTVTVRAVDDALVESDHTATITHAITATGDATNYPTSLEIFDVTVSVTDNDVVAVTAVDDASTVNAGEDVVSTEAVLAPQANLLANDLNGIGNFVSAFDAVSTLGAAVNVALDGTFTYDPSPAVALQSLAVGATATDTFTYTVEDIEGNSSVGTVTITVDGANDSPEAANDFLNDGPLEDETSFLSTLDLTANDGIHRTVPLTFPAGSDLRTHPGITTSQSPSAGAPPGGGVPGNALDGNLGNFTHTDSVNDGTPHSWQVDFGEEVSLESMSIFNRTNCCGERLQDITVTVLDAGGATVFTSDLLNPDNALGFLGTSGGQLDVDFAGPIMGQTVVVTRTPKAVGSLGDPANEAVLSLGEVTIIGSSATVFAVDKLILNYDASQTADAGRWENLGSRAGSAMDWLLTGVTLDSSPGSARAQIAAAYVWDALTDRAMLAGASDSIHDIVPGDPDADDATWEFWLKPANTSQIMTIFETGGGTGFGCIINNGVLEAATELDGGSKTGSYVSYDLVADPLGLVGGDPTSEFNQYLVTINTGNGLQLYVNGVLVDETTSGSGNDWDGGDASGLGIWGENNHGGFTNGAAGTAYDAPFLGSMAAVRLYEGVLSPSKILQNFNAVSNGTDLEGESITAAGVIDATGTLVPIGTQATLASGALVTMTDATGAFDYNPNGAFVLSPGVSTNDTFTYQATDGSGGAAEADVTLTITGSVIDSFDDTVTVLEAGERTVFPNQVVGNDDSTLGAADAYVNLNPDSIAGTAWINNGSSVRNDGTIFGSVPASAIPSNFGALGTAVTSATMQDLDPVSADDATFEIWFKPDPGQTGQSTVFEVGGDGNGFSIVYDADTNEVTATVDGGDNALNFMKATAGGVMTGEFNQFIVVYDKDSGPEVGGVGTGVFEDSLTVYLNSDPTSPFDPTVDGSSINANGTADDWCGIDDGGMNVLNNTTALGENLPGMLGAVAIVRVYTRVLTLAEMEGNFDAVVQPITMVSATTTGGNAVTLNADGSVTIDYTGVSLLTGETLDDSFTYSISDGLGGTSTATANVVVAGYSVLQDWRIDNGVAFDGSEDLTDKDGDGLVALLELGFGTDATVGDNLALLLDGTRNGTPIAVSTPGVGGLEFDAVFVRRKDYADIGLTYTVQFSTNLVDFYDSTDTPTLVVDSTDGLHEVVKVPYPFFTPDGKAQYFRVMVTLNP